MTGQKKFLEPAGKNFEFPAGCCPPDLPLEGVAVPQTSLDIGEFAALQTPSLGGRWAPSLFSKTKIWKNTICN